MSRPDFRHTANCSAFDAKLTQAGTESGIVNQTLPNGDGLQIYAIAFSLAGEGASTFGSTAPILRHAEVW
jgi:hypothetical protein